jgi:hypothetical protein
VLRAALPSITCGCCGCVLRCGICCGCVLLRCAAGFAAR